MNLKKAAVVFQKQLRGQIARRVYKQLLAEKRAEEEKKKRAEEEKRKREEEERYGTFLGLDETDRRTPLAFLCSISSFAAGIPSGCYGTCCLKQ